MADAGREPLAIIGGGRVGKTLGRLWRLAGWPVVAVTCRLAERAREAADFIGTEPSTDNAEAAMRARVLVIATGDDVMGEVIAGMARGGAFVPDHVVLHTSGAQGLAVLGPAAAAGAAIGAIHPIHSFAVPEPTAQALRGCVWGITADERASRTALGLVDDAGGVAVAVAEHDRALYHAAAAVASNATVGVLDLALTLLSSCGFADEEAMRAVEELARSTVDNVASMGPVDALTGPIARGDVKTIERHLEVLAASSPELVGHYRALGRLVLGVALRRGTLGDGSARALARLLGTEEDA